MEKVLELLLVEDDTAACKEIVDVIDKNPDTFKLIGITNNSLRAFQYVQENYPDAVILENFITAGATVWNF